MKEQHLQRKSHIYDEDRFVIGKNFYMVIDGATPLDDNNLNKNSSTASWFVAYIKKNLLKYKGLNIVEKLNEISKKAYEEYVNLYDNSSFPSAGIAWVEEHNNILDCYYIGDCEIVIRFKNGDIKRIIDERLPNLDQQALNYIIEYSKTNNISILKARKACNHILIKNRNLMNKPNGYSVYTISNNPCFEYNKQSFNLDDINEIYVYTDGITQAFDELKIYSSYKDMFNKSLDLKEEISKIVVTANGDADCNIYPRFKKIDDITIIKITK